MTSQIIQQKNGLLNTAAFIDWENIYAAIQAIVIVSSDSDMVPLLQAIKYENKIACLFSTRTGFNRVAIRYVDYHEYIEDIFNLTPAPAAQKDEQATNTGDREQLTQRADQQRAGGKRIAL